MEPNTEISMKPKPQSPLTPTSAQQPEEWKEPSDQNLSLMAATVLTLVST